MKILNSIHLAEDNIPNGQLVIPHRANRHQLTVLDLAAHAVPSRPEFNGLALLKRFDVFACPTHSCLFNATPSLQ
jgi:hypothetical protein